MDDAATPTESPYERRILPPGIYLAITTIGLAFGLRLTSVFPSGLERDVLAILTEAIPWFRNSYPALAGMLAVSIVLLLVVTTLVATAVADYIEALLVENALRGTEASVSAADDAASSLGTHSTNPAGPGWLWDGMLANSFGRATRFAHYSASWQLLVWTIVVALWVAFPRLPWWAGAALTVLSTWRTSTGLLGKGMSLFSALVGTLLFLFAMVLHDYAVKPKTESIDGFLTFGKGSAEWIDCGSRQREAIELSAMVRGWNKVMRAAEEAKSMLGCPAGDPVFCPAPVVHVVGRAYRRVGSRGADNQYSGLVSFISIEKAEPNA
ncbi:MAG TPA: hypothetical protein VFQ61_00460, partial [Polyangiaceae bacterium]|nr:hypothetical protein [Polyangiaceae bacterium]